MHIQHLLVAETSRHKFTMSGFIELSRSTFHLSALAFSPPNKKQQAKLQSRTDLSITVPLAQSHLFPLRTPWTGSAVGNVYTGWE